MQQPAAHADPTRAGALRQPRLNRLLQWPRPRALVLALLAASVLSACQRPSADTPAATPPQAAASAPAATPVAYIPPPADSLYQMVAPIALYPDRLVAQVLAASTYPDQITNAESWLARNPGLRGDALARAADAQPWDPSVKALTAFPNVLEQLASNLPWTTALGQAYFHDAPDVMNAIQVMRGRAAQAGTLRSSPRLKVVTASAPLAQPVPAPAAVTPAVPLYAGPPRVAPPPTVIAIEPAEPATVYVPRYDPQQVYGTPVAVYPGYRWVAPPPVVVTAQPGPSPWLVFGSGVVVGAVATWGWNAWNVHWGPPRPPVWVNGPPPPPTVQPVVVYRGATYVSNSRTVIENVHNHVTVNHTTINNNDPAAAPGAPVALPAMHPPSALAAPAQAMAAFAPPRPGAAPAPAIPTPPRALALSTALSPVQQGSPAHPQGAMPVTPHSAPLRPHAAAHQGMPQGGGPAAPVQGLVPPHADTAGMPAAGQGREAGRDATRETGHERAGVLAAQAGPAPERRAAAAMPAAPVAQAQRPAMPSAPPAEPRHRMQAAFNDSGAQRAAALRDDGRQRGQERWREETPMPRMAEPPRPMARAEPQSTQAMHPTHANAGMPPVQQQHRPQAEPRPQQPPHAQPHAPAAEHRAPQGEHHRPHGG